MDIDKIVGICVNGNYSKTEKTDRILAVISEDERAIEYVLKMLFNERNREKVFKQDARIVVSKAIVCFDDPKLAKRMPDIKDQLTSFLDDNKLTNVFKMEH